MTIARSNLNRPIITNGGLGLTVQQKEGIHLNALAYA